jgi:arsenate reductase
MAEGFARHYHPDRLEAHSAGLVAHGLNARAVKVMEEAGVDISSRKSKTLDDLGSEEVDWVVTVCSHAHETCPRFPGKARVMHVGFDDPPRLAEGARSEEEALSHYRRVRDEIAAFVRELPETLERAGRG